MQLDFNLLFEANFFATYLLEMVWREMAEGFNLLFEAVFFATEN